MAGPLALARLGGAAWLLIRADALLPRELEPDMPPAARLAGRLLRLFAGPRARVGRPGERLAATLERLGPVAIKFGQFLSTRSDIVGVTFGEDLSRLKDRLPSFGQDLARVEVERALGRPIDSLFSAFEAPMAAASLAQAHRARLLDGTVVAVKVLRPGIERRVARDCETLLLAGDLAERWAPSLRRLRPRAFVATVARALSLELDLRLEAAGADELGEAMAADGYMGAPKVTWEGVGRRVLTLAWASGVALSDPASLLQPGLDRPALANRLVRAFLAQALDHGVFHADLHEGNLFVDAAGALTAVDYGIVGRLGPAERRYLAEILWGFLRRDYARVAEVHFEAGYVPAHQDRGMFAQALRAVGEPVFGKSASQLSMGRLLAQLFEITGLFEMDLRPELVLLQKTMVTVEGVARRIDPDHDIWAAAEPVVRRWIARELSPAARARALGAQAMRIAGAVARGLEREPVAAEPRAEASSRAWVAFAAGAVLAAAAFAAGALVR